MTLSMHEIICDALSKLCIIYLARACGALTNNKEGFHGNDFSGNGKLHVRGQFLILSNTGNVLR